MPNTFAALPVRDIFDTLMGTDGVGDEIAVSPDAGAIIQPPAGETWIISTITTYGDGANAGYASLYDGSLRADYLLNPGVNIGQGDLDFACFRDGKIFIDNTNYLWIHNHNAGSRVICYSGEKWSLAGNRGIKADIISLATITSSLIIPPAGEVWCITTVTARHSVTNQQSAYLYVATGGTDGAILSPNLGIGEGNTSYGCFRDGKVMISPNLKLRITNYATGTNSVSYSGVQWQ